MVQAFDRVSMRKRVELLAAQGVYVGTSSWKYQGWLNQLYTPSRYEFRGKVANTRFEKGCLAEYAETFKTVCLDAAYYTFPSEAYLTGLASQVPSDFLFGLKVTDLVTIKKFPMQPRFGDNAGKKNEQFLNPDLFEIAFLKPLESIRQHVGVLMFEFSRFHKTDYAHGRDFVADLDRFLAALPGGWPYAIEMRNATWLTPEYLACLAKHRVTHVFNSWEAMPPVSQQREMPGSVTNPALVAARFLLKPGRKYAAAVGMFEPYESVKEVNRDAREAGHGLICEGLETPTRKTFIYVNNRMEGNALGTIAAMTSDWREPEGSEMEKRRARISKALGDTENWRACWANQEFVSVMSHDAEPDGEERAIACGLKVLADTEFMDRYKALSLQVIELDALRFKGKMKPEQDALLEDLKRKLHPDP